MISRSFFYRRSFAPALVKLESALSTWAERKLVVLYAHLYPGPDGYFAEDSWRANLEYLSRGCSVLPLDEALHALAGRKRLPPRAVSLIVDDATRAFFNSGRRLLDEYQIPYTLAVIPGLIESDDRNHLLSRLMRIAGHEYWLPPQELLELTANWFVDRTGWKVSTFSDLFLSAQQLERDHLQELVNLVKPAPDDFLDWSSLRSLRGSQQVTFASHTMSHPRLEFAQGEWLRWELAVSKDLLERNLQVDIKHFVVPYGNPRHYSAELAAGLERCGYQYGFFTTRGSIVAGKNRYKLPRMALEVDEWKLSIHTCPIIVSYLFPGPP